MRAAASPVPYFEGTNASCVTVLGQTDCELASVRLSISVPEYGVGVYGANAPVSTATYALYNPTDSAQTVRLGFPYELVRRGDAATSWNEKENCTLTGEDGSLSYETHYTYKKSSGFDALACAKHLSGEYTDEFYKSDLTVTKYVYRIALDEGEPDCYIKAYLKGDTNSKIVRGENCVSGFEENLYRCLGCMVSQEENTISYCVIGGENEIACLSRTRRDKRAYAEELTAVLEEKTVTTFSEWVSACRLEALGEDDWYHAVVDYFNDNDCSGILLPIEFCAECPFVRWYVYDLTVPAGGTTEHTVTAPLYPASSTEANKFCYQLSPLSGFNKCGEITIELKTPYHVQYSTVELTPKEGGYTFSREGLPYGEFTFSLAQEPPGQPFVPDDNAQNSLIVAIVVLIVVVAGAVVTAVVLSVRGKKAYEKSELARRRAEMGKCEEGRIDEENTDDKTQEKK